MVPHKTLYNRFIRLSRFGVFDRIFVALTEQAGHSKRLMIDATHLKAHRASASLFKKGLLRAMSGRQKAAWPQNFAPCARIKTAPSILI
ncbi:hypothetical protein ACI01nite_23200 [Acetobacter cibinongensis]|uniref:Transposase n=1 Tax=Acetobacter cibinongensis TaxID=146475 RepID=A0ABQ0V780_9PROT|nr:hypothetical protein ACI01nite_23200 [Acetobacter cibinongensis]